MIISFSVVVILTLVRYNVLKILSSIIRKTWSMQGLVQSDNDELEGVIPRMNRALFERIEKQKALSPTLHFLITCSYFELYNEVIFDLLDVNDRKNKRMGLEIKEHPVLGKFVRSLTYVNL